MGRKKRRRKPEPHHRWSWTGARGRTLWEWAQLLIVPVVLVIAGFIFALWQDARTQRLEEQRAQDLALQGYLDQMGTLVLEDLGDRKVRAAMRARTLIVLDRVDPSRRAEVMQFLGEANLSHTSGKRPPAVSLNGANLQDTELFNARLDGAKLTNADLDGANLEHALMNDATLIYTDLREANLRDAELTDANLTFAQFDGADLRDASLAQTNLRGADLREANLRDAQVSDQHLLSYDSLGAVFEGATMPDGQTYEDWLKDKKAREEEGKNDGVKGYSEVRKRGKG